jgi:pimeloyl-ACP methyl ester carboxylesterase
MKTIDTPLLRIAYEESNPQAPRSVVLLHGWPDSPRCWAGVAPVLAQVGWRVIVPALRGFAPTRFLREDTPRTGQLAALGRDLLDLIDALGLQRPALVGHDWGARAAANACGLRPGVASHLALLSVGYGTNVPGQSLSLAQARNYWYHWYMATPRGERTVREDRRAFARTMWDTWSPAGWYREDEFAATALAFDNDDWPDITLHSYRHRWGHAPGDPSCARDEAALDPAPRLDVPTLVLHGAADGANHPDTSAGKEAFFRGRYERQVLPGVGHFPQREAPDAVAQALLRFLG